MKRGSKKGYGPDKFEPVDPMEDDSNTGSMAPAKLPGVSGTAEPVNYCKACNAEATPTRDGIHKCQCRTEGV